MTFILAAKLTDSDSTSCCCCCLYPIPVFPESVENLPETIDINDIQLVRQSYYGYEEPHSDGADYWAINSDGSQWIAIRWVYESGSYTQECAFSVGFCLIPNSVPENTCGVTSITDDFLSEYTCNGETLVRTGLCYWDSENYSLYYRIYEYFDPPNQDRPKKGRWELNGTTKTSGLQDVPTGDYEAGTVE